MNARLNATILVVGGGPAGAATAALLAQRGHDVLVVEKAKFPREKPCAEYFSPGTLDVLERIGARGAVEDAGGFWVQGMRVISADRSFLISYPDSVNQNSRRRALGMPRWLFDSTLLRHAQASGARVWERARVLGAVVREGRVVGVHVITPEGRETLYAQVVVAADGLHSAVARSLGLEERVHWPLRLGMVARFAGWNGPPATGEMYVGRGLYCGIAPVGDGQVNVGLVAPLASRHAGEPARTFFERRLADLPGAVRALSGMRRVTPVRGIGPLARRVRRVEGPGYLLVGDAAGFLDPFTGEGVYRALRGAEIAADAVHKMLAQGAEIPQGYEATRRAVFGDKEVVCLLVQAFLGSRRALDYLLGHLGGRPQIADALSKVLGDYGDAREVLRPRFLWGLLQP